MKETAINIKVKDGKVTIGGLSSIQAATLLRCASVIDRHLRDLHFELYTLYGVTDNILECAFSEDERVAISDVVEQLSLKYEKRAHFDKGL